jgi:hypothetical protein
VLLNTLAPFILGMLMISYVFHNLWIKKEAIEELESEKFEKINKNK